MTRPAPMDADRLDYCMVMTLGPDRQRVTIWAPTHAKAAWEAIKIIAYSPNARPLYLVHVTRWKTAP